MEMCKTRWKCGTHTCNTTQHHSKHEIPKNCNLCFLCKNREKNYPWIHVSHQRLSGSAFKTDRWKMPGSIPDCTCQRSFEVFRGFPWNFQKYGLGSLRKALIEGITSAGPAPTYGQLALIPKSNRTLGTCESWYKNH